MRKQREWGDRWKGTLMSALSAHNAWLARGRVGEGRLEIVDEDCRGARVRVVSGARFERCDLSGAAINGMEGVELIACTVDDALLMRSNWTGARVEACTFRGSFFAFSHFEDARIIDSDALGAQLETTFWTRSDVRGVRFRGCRLVDAVFEEAMFVDCDFLGADLSRKDLMGDLARAPGTRFVSCDFRNANLDGFRANNTVFENCKFYGMSGRPDLEGACTLINPDFSPGANEGEISSGVSGMFAPEDVLRALREFDATRLRHWASYGPGMQYEPQRFYPERRNQDPNP